MLRTSSYTIAVELPDGEFALAHGYTGALDRVSHSVGMRLKEGRSCYVSYNPEVDNVLKNRGYITELTPNEEYDYFRRITAVLLKKNDVTKKSHFTIVVTYNCNFCCPYCYEKELFAGFSEFKNKVISGKAVDMIFSTIPQIEPESEKRIKQIMLFGGEPLLKENLPIIRYIISKGRESGCRFVVTSNGYDIDCYEDYLDNDIIESIQITLDGPPEINDCRRRHKNGLQTFNKIIANIKLVLSKGVAISVRVNVDNENKGHIDELYRILNSEGILESKLFTIYVEYISGEINFNPAEYDGTYFSRKEYLSLIENSNYNLKNDVSLSSNIEKAIKNRTRLSFKPKHCSAQSSAYIFDPFGNIYSCYDEIGKKNSRIGTYIPSLSWNDSVRDSWFGRDISVSKKCSRCRYALFCGGGCYSKQLISQQEDGYCDDFPLRFNSSLKRILTLIN